MRQREFLGVLSGAAAWPLAARAPRLFDHLIGERQQAWRQRNPECIAVLEIDNNLKSHVQQRPPGVIFRLEVLGLLLAS